MRVASVSSGAVFSGYRAGTHQCSAYCRDEEHAYIGFGSKYITEADVREALAQMGYKVTRVHFTSEVPITERGLETAAPITQAYIFWLKGSLVNGD